MCIHLGELYTFEFCALGKNCVLIFCSGKKSIEVWRLPELSWDFLNINSILFRRKKRSWLGAAAPDITKNVVSIFIEVLYCSRVEDIYYLNYFTGKDQGFA